MMGDDMQLVGQYAASQSEAAFAELVSRHTDLVYSTALRFTHHPQLAEEITQAVFIILARKAGALDQNTIIPGWLYRVACYTSASALKREHRRLRREQEAYMQSKPDQPFETEAQAVWKQLAPLLEEAMLRLNESDRDALVLRFFQGRTLGEVGIALGASEDAAKKRVNRAIEKLRKLLAKRGITSSAAAITLAISAHSIHAAPATLAQTAAAVAVAKGTAAGASTSTLIQGSLKLMAWTKAKTTVVAGTVALIATIGTVTLTSHLRHLAPRQSGLFKLPPGNRSPSASIYDSFGFVLAPDGSLWTWGAEDLGWPVLGIPGVRNTPMLRRIGTSTDWTSVSAGSHCLATKADGTLWGWGANFRHQLGAGRERAWPTMKVVLPGNDWKQAVASGAHSLALKADGTLWAWGDNWAGQLGIGTTQDATNATRVGTSTNWTKIWANGVVSLGQQSDGTLWQWGSLLANESDTNHTTPAQVSPDTNWTDLCFGYSTAFGLKSDGTLWCWGLNANYYTHASTDLNPTPGEIGSNSDWQACSSGGGFYLLLQKRDGSLWALDASDHRMVKPPNEYRPVTLRKIDFRKDVAAFAAGRDDIGLVITRDGELWTWGTVLGEQTPGNSGRGYNRPTPRTVNHPWQLSRLEQ